MVEWHITPDYISNNWTDELFTLMCEKLTERKKRELDAMRDKSQMKSRTEVVSDKELFRRIGMKVKRGN